MTLRTNPRARVRPDRAGDPLDGLVNLFDLGIVLAVAFLLAALTSLKMTGTLFSQPHGAQAPPITATGNEGLHNVNLQPGQRVVGNGTPVGTVYRLSDGQLVYVAPTTTAPPTTTP